MSSFAVEQRTTYRAAQCIINDAVDLIVTYGNVRGSEHKAWVIDQVLRILAVGPDKYDICAALGAFGDADGERHKWPLGNPPPGFSRAIMR